MFANCSVHYTKMKFISDPAANHFVLEQTISTRYRARK